VERGHDYKWFYQGRVSNMGTKRVGLARLEALMKAFVSYPTLSGANAYRAAGRSLCTFDQQPIVFPTGSLSASLLSGGGTGDATDTGVEWVPGADTITNIHQYSSGMRLHVTNIGDQATNVVPAIATNGMNYSYIATDDFGLQWEARRATEKGVLNGDYFKIGTSPKFFVRCRFTLVDVSDTDDCLIGFKPVVAPNATVDNYTDMAAINVNAGKFFIETILNNATTVTDSEHGDATTWADGESHELKVEVDKSGSPTYYLDGAKFTNAALSSSFLFDSGDLVTPFMYHIHAASSTMGIVYEELEWGLV